MYTEIIGPPGSGKSTIYRNLISKSGIYGGTNDSYRFRLLSNPQYIKRHHAFVDFVTDNPGYLELMSRSMEIVHENKRRIVEMYKKSAERYKIGIETKRKNELLIYEDDGLITKLAVVMYQNIRDDFIKDFFNYIPLPERIIYIDVPPRLCIKRQNMRGNLKNAPYKQEHLQDIYEKLLSTYPGKVIRVENTGAISDSISIIERKLDEFGDF